jgi:hypothetical protein
MEALSVNVPTSFFYTPTATQPLCPLLCRDCGITVIGFDVIPPQADCILNVMFAFKESKFRESANIRRA